MDLEHHRRVDIGASDRFCVVGHPGAVGGADVDESGAGLFDHFGDTERSTDLDTLTSADWHITPVGERRNDEQHCSGIVVDDHCLLGAAQPCEKLADGGLPRSSLAGRQVELDGLCRGCLLVGERRPAEVRVEEHAGCVDYRCQQGAPKLLGACGC